MRDESWRSAGKRPGIRPLAAAALISLAAHCAAATAAAADPLDAARGALSTLAAALCPGGLDDPAVLAAALPGFALGEVTDSGPPGAWQRREARFVAAEADLVLLVTALRPGGVLRRYALEARGRAGERPLLLAMAAPDCSLLFGRALDYRNGTAAELLLLAPDLVTETGREPLDPPVPAGRDVEGVTVALVDAGVNYLLPAIAERLARNGQGEILGYDFWDLDGRPFDADTARSAFFPQRHGTRVASLLLAQAPQARLLPFRYPRPDMARMAEVVAAAEAAAATVVAMPLGSNRQSDWIAFEAAARARPRLLFVVSAGNNGRDIDTDPVFPAALPLDNMIVVTSANDDGSPARGSNWGAVAVDLLVPAENQAVIDFDGRATRASGSSFAVPRVAALALRLKAAHPLWGAAELKAAIFAHALPPAGPARGSVAVGWLSEEALAAP